MLSPIRLYVVCNVRAPYSGGCNFRQYFYGIFVSDIAVFVLKGTLNSN